MHQLPLALQYLWLGCAILAVLGGAVSLFLLLTRVLPMTRELRDTSREMLSIAITGKTREGKSTHGSGDLKRIAVALEERIPKPPKPKARLRGGAEGVMAGEIEGEDGGLPESP